MRLDHLILPVNDLDASLDFYTRIVGLAREPDRPPFSVLRVTPDFVILLGSWGTKGGEHLAFAMTASELDGAFRRIKEVGIEYGDAFDAVGNMRGPGVADGARGATRSLYIFDPSRHLIELASYG